MRIKNILSSKKVFLPFILCILVIICGYFFYYTNNRSRNDSITTKLGRLNKDGVTCEDVIREIGSTSDTDLKKFEDKKVLLERQMLCFTDDQQYDHAIMVANKLKILYSSSSDSKNLQRIERKIKDIEATKQEVKNEEKNSDASTKE
jgi:hypothetical protein